MVPTEALLVGKVNPCLGYNNSCEYKLLSHSGKVVSAKYLVFLLDG